MRAANAHCRKFETQTVRRVAARACMIAGKRMAARSAIRLTLTSNSSKVKPEWLFGQARRISDPGHYAQVDIAVSLASWGGAINLWPRRTGQVTGRSACAFGSSAKVR